MKEKNKKNEIQKKHPLIEFDKIVSYIQKLLSKKYFVSKTSYQKYLIKNIIYDDKRRLVSVFKEQLIINDTSEYMKRFYKYRESIIRLNKYNELYEEYSKLYPNYTPLNEAKYIYINIHKKQKIIDLQQNNSKLKLKKKFKGKNYKVKSNKIFSSEVYESIEKNSENINSAIFGIHNDEKNNSIINIQNIINMINKYEFNFDNINFNLNNKKIKNIKNKNIIINNYYYNNNSILTKNIPIESLFIQPQNNFINSKNFSIIKNNILTNLKKNKKPKININSYTIKNAISYQKNKPEKNVLSDTFKMINLTKKKSKNKSVINNTNINSISNSIGNKNIKMNKNTNKNIFKNNTQYSNIIPHTSRINNYKNMKLNSILKKLANSDINNSSSLKRGSKVKKEKIKINRSLISQIINQKNNILTERLDNNINSINNIDNKKKAEKNKIKITNRTSRENTCNNKLKIYLEIIKKKGNRDSLYNKPSDSKNQKLNFDLKTDRIIYNINNINNNKISKRTSIKEKNIKKLINKKNYISTAFLTNENRIKNKHKKIISEKKKKTSTKYVSININNISNNNTNINSKVKIKGIQIKNFNKIFNVNKDKNNITQFKTSERSKKIELNISNNNKKKIQIKKNKYINNNNIISYTEREKAKRLFLSNNI